MSAITNTPIVPVEEYIARFVDGNEKPACEYVDGELVPKAMGTIQHSQVQVNLALAIRSQYGKRFRALTELTARIQPSRFLIPDVAVQKQGPIQGRYPGPGQPVHLCIEIISPPDRVGKLWAKCEDYHTWGVEYCWVIDPERRVAWEYFANDAEPRKVTGLLTAGEIQLSLDDVFVDL